MITHPDINWKKLQNDRRVRVAQLMRDLNLNHTKNIMADVNGLPYYLKVEDVFVVEKNGLRQLSPCGYSLKGS